MLSEPMYECTSEADANFFFESSQKHFCKECIKKYCESLCKLYQFQKFKKLLFAIFFSIFIRQKMCKKFKMCGCFQDVACYCLEINATLDQFQKECVKLNGGWNDIFIIKNVVRNRSMPIPVTYFACCKKFVNFQIDLFVKTQTFPLRTIDCRYSWSRQAVNFEL